MNTDPDELFKWIDSHTISRQKRNLNRDFSDAIPMAEILKHHFPKLVDLHNYSPKNAFAHKLSNWEILNRRVLHKLKINLSAQEMEQLAKATPGAVEKLLSAIKAKTDQNKPSGDACNTNEKIFYLENDNNFTSRETIVPVKIKNGTKTLDRKMVPNEMFDQMQRDIVNKQELINTLKGKVDHLENILKIKDERIKDLTQQLQTIVNGNNGANLLSPKSRFFNKIF